MTSVVVVGAGLAGMVAARLLAQQGYEVTVLEAGKRAGGKAGADFEDNKWREHGYHIFPSWYFNIRKLIGELQEEHQTEFIDFDQFYYLLSNKDRQKPQYRDRKLKYGTMIPMYSFDSFSNILKNIFSGLAPWPEVFLQAYFVIDALAERMSRKHFLDRISRTGLLRSRWYANDRIAELEGESTLKASAIPAYEMSAMTAKLVTGYWLKNRSPFLSILNQNLQTAFVEPILELVKKAGVEVRFESRVKGLDLDGNRMLSVTLQNGEKVSADQFIITTPLEVTRSLVKSDLLKQNHKLGNLQHLEAAPMAALHLSLNRKLDNIPREHVFFKGGEFGLSFIDLSNHWPDMENSELSFISSNFMPLQQLSEDAQFELLFEEIKKYIAISEPDIVSSKFLPNSEDPLFINTVAAWASRPDVKDGKVENLYFAGDWVRSGIDLACMEGAVSTAMLAAHALDKAVNGSTMLEEPLVPKQYSILTMKILKAVLFPFVVLAWLISRLR
ncbi:MAG: FAD-dependent oxidoreductase [Acidiferrobacterales bacterium]